MTTYAIHRTRRRWWDFPYLVVDETNGVWPYGRIVQVAMTQWGARRAIRKDRQRGPHDASPGSVIERVKS